MAPTRHPVYFLEDGNCVFLVQNTLFKLHRSILSMNSPLFKDMFSLPPAEGSTEGQTEDDPIVLPDQQLDSDAFALLVELLYNSASIARERPLDVWRRTLDVAHKLQCDSVSELVLRELGRFPLPALERIAIAQRFAADRRVWARSAFIELVRRDAYIAVDEGERIGLPDALRIAQAREIYKHHVAGGCPSAPPAPAPARRRMLRAAPYQVPVQAQPHSVAHGIASGFAVSNGIAAPWIIPAPPAPPHGLSPVQQLQAHMLATMPSAVVQPMYAMAHTNVLSPDLVGAMTEQQLAEKIVDIVFQFGASTGTSNIS